MKRVTRKLTSSMAVSMLMLSISAPVAFVHAKEPAPEVEEETDLSNELPIFSQNLGFYLPAGWKLAFQKLESNMYSAEYVPAKQKLRRWKSLFCVQGYQGMADSVSPQQFFDSFAATYKQTCQGEVYLKQLENVQISGNNGISALMGCTLMPNTHRSDMLKEHAHQSQPQGEMGYYTVLEGRDDLYMLHKSIRGNVFTLQSLPVNQDTWPAFIKDMKPYSLQ